MRGWLTRFRPRHGTGVMSGLRHGNEVSPAAYSLSATIAWLERPQSHSNFARLRFSYASAGSAEIKRMGVPHTEQTGG